MRHCIEIEELIEPLLEEYGFELVGVELLKGGNTTTLRVYIDKEDTGITIDDIGKVSRQISAHLDVDGPDLGKYFLEVSSPGLDRPLFKLSHFAKQVGHQIQLKLSSPISGRYKFKGILQKLEGEHIFLQVDDKVFQIAFDQIEKARVIPEIVIGAAGSKGVNDEY